MKQNCHVGAGTPRALLARNEVNVCVWTCTPLLGGSVSQLLMQFSSTANALRGVLYRKETTSSSKLNAFMTFCASLTMRNSIEVKV